MTSTFSLRKSIPKKNKPNQMRSLARYHRYLLFDTIMINHPIATIGRANADILNSPNPRYHTINHVAVDQILAPTNTPTALINCIIPALTNHRVSKEINVLLLSIAVTIVPTNVAFRPLSVYCCKIRRNFGQPSFFILSLNISLPKRISQRPAHNIHRFIEINYVDKVNTIIS